MKTEVKIDRKELGQGASNTLTALPLKFKYVKEAKRQDTIDEMVLYLLVNILIVDGEPQPAEWYGELPNGTYLKFVEAFCDLTDIEDRKPLGLLTNKEIKEIKEENSSKKK